MDREPDKELGVKFFADDLHITKKVSDNFGHSLGGQFIVSVANVLQQNAAPANEAMCANKKTVQMPNM